MKNLQIFRYFRMFGTNEEGDVIFENKEGKLLELGFKVKITPFTSDNDLLDFAFEEIMEAGHISKKEWIEMCFEYYSQNDNNFGSAAQTFFELCRSKKFENESFLDFVDWLDDWSDDWKFHNRGSGFEGFAEDFVAESEHAEYFKLAENYRLEVV